MSLSPVRHPHGRGSCLFRNLRLWGVVLGLWVSIAQAQTESVKVFYGGFAFAGRADEIGRNYPFAASLGEPSQDAAAFFESVARDFFRRRTGKTQAFALSFDLVRPEDSPLVMVLALSDEKVLVENLGDFHKLVVQLGFDLLVLDFREMTVVSSLPISLDLIDAGPSEYSHADITKRLREMVAGDASQLLPVLEAKLSTMRIRTAQQATLQIHQVTVGEKALPFLPVEYRQMPGAYGEACARQLGGLLTSEAKIALLPYAKDGVNGKMALRFADASVLQFRIPAPTFALDLDIKGFKKVLDKSTPAEALWLYGAFLGVRVYEPEFQRVYFDAPVKYAVSKVIPASQKTTNEFPVVSEALKGAFLSTIEQMRKDKTTYETVLKKCAL